jgi:hypothetical protein
VGLNDRSSVNSFLAVANGVIYVRSGDDNV